MTDQITVPKQTWYALINALENHPGNYKLTKSECAAMAEVLTAANAVSDIHASDCAVHNEPAYPNGPCNCDAASAVSVEPTP